MVKYFKILFLASIIFVIFGPAEIKAETSSTGILSPQGTPFNMRGLPLEYLNRPLTTYQVVRPIEVFRGVASEYGEGGGGMQYFLGEDSNGESVTVEKLLESGHLKEAQ